jgi:hypothetical protein
MAQFGKDRYSPLQRRGLIDAYSRLHHDFDLRAFAPHERLAKAKENLEHFTIVAQNQSALHRYILETIQLVAPGCSQTFSDTLSVQLLDTVWARFFLPVPINPVQVDLANGDRSAHDFWIMVPPWPYLCWQRELLK